jgi:hypothetical protein
MDDIWKQALWSQFGATIDMFGNALDTCPDELWTAPMWNDPVMGPKFSEFWYVAYHTIFWLDLYLKGSVEGFIPPAPFDLNELDPQGLLARRQFTKDDLRSYLSDCRKKCRETIEALTDEKISQICTFSWRRDGLSFAELMVDNMRHVQEHGAQLNMYIGQRAGVSAGWLAQTKDDGEK